MSEEGGPVESPDLPEPHPDDPWHPGWRPGDPSDGIPAGDPVVDAVRRVQARVQRLTEDAELRTSLEAAATGRRMLEQIGAVRDGGPSSLFPASGDDRPVEDEPEDVSLSGGAPVPESTERSSPGWWGRLRRRGSPDAEATPEEDAAGVADVRGDGEMTDDRPVDDESRNEPSATDVEAADDDDFPWDDEDWSAARPADDPRDTRELDLVADAPPVEPSPEDHADETEVGEDDVALVEEEDDAAEVLAPEADELESVAVPEVVAALEADGAEAGGLKPVEELAADGPEVEEPAADEADWLVAEVVAGEVVAPDADEPEVGKPLADTPLADEPAADEPDAVVAGVVAPVAEEPEPVVASVAGTGTSGSALDDSDATLELDADATLELDADATLELDADATLELDADATLELDAVASPEIVAPDVATGEEVAEETDPVQSAMDEEGVFTHAEVIPLVRPPEIGADEATAGLDPDLLAAAEDPDDEPSPDREHVEAPPDAAAPNAKTDAYDDEDDGAESEFAAFSLEDYTGTATEEYAELARAVAASDDEALEPAAISAEMPGLDTTLVGLDDVVDAGIGVTETISTTRRSDLGLRVATALGLLVVFFGSLLWPWAIGGLILVVLGVASLELYIVTVNAGYRPLTWAGLVGVVGALAGTWIWGVVAIPIALALTAIGATLFLALSAARRTPLLDLALTVAMMAWIGVLGAPAFEIVEAPEFRWLILAVVLTTAFMDVAQYFVGRALGRRKLSPVVSPKKTIEGLVGGVFVALIVGVVFGSIEASPFDPGSGLAFGALVAVVAPLGDLAVSVVKRALAVKDMSAILPGHGGIMDRIDAMVFVIPSAWIHFQYFDLLG